MSLIMRECDFKYTFHNAESSESIAAAKGGGISLFRFLSLYHRKTCENFSYVTSTRKPILAGLSLTPTRGLFPLIFSGKWETCDSFAISLQIIACHVTGMFQSSVCVCVWSMCVCVWI